MATTPERNQPPFNLGEGTGPLVLLAGAVAGLVLLVVGVWLTTTWWATLTGGLEEWHKHWWQLMVCELCLFGGLAVMFAALQVARAEERTNPAMRRLLYGYNAVLSCLLVLTILAHLNVFAYLPVWPLTYAHETYDWSGSERYNLEPTSVEVLRRLDKPVKIYVLLPSGSNRAQYTLREMRMLLEKCREVDRHLDVEELSPDLSPQAVAQLQEKYQLPERQGMLVVYGTAGDEKSEFVPVSDFAPQVAGGGMGGGESERIEFKGEAALIRALTFLTEDKHKPVIYFTQGNGELDLNNSDPARDDRGVGVLRDRLSRASYDVKELRLGLGADKVPDDADVVVIARPTRAYPEPALNALRDYLKPPAGAKNKKQGKLVVLFDVAKDPEGRMVHTGLEDWLRKEAGVQVDDDHVVAAVFAKDPLFAPVMLNPDLNNSALASALSRYQDALIPMYDVRTVHAAERNPAGPPPTDFQAEPFLVTDVNRYCWKQTNLNVDVLAEVEPLRKPDHMGDLLKKVSREPLPVAVAVSELGAADPNDPHGFMNRKQVPRMLVFGDATWVSNRPMNQTVFYDLFTGCLGWLRDRPDTTKLEAKERKAYTLSPKDVGQFAAQVLYLPLALLAVGIVGLGAGVWMVRRR